MSEYLDLVWVIMLEEGKGGFVDFAKYREALTKIFWDVTQTEAGPESALEEAKRLRDEMMGLVPDEE